MFSPAKAITAGALVFALGGVSLIAQLSEQQGGSVPGAETDTGAVPATWVTGTVAPAPSCSGPTTEDDAGVLRERDYLCEPQTWTTSDPRLTSLVAVSWNADVYTLDEGEKSVLTAAHHLRNEGGEWACRSNALQHGAGISLAPLFEGNATLMCVGEGEYEGLSAILLLDSAGPGSIVGLIFPGDAPPLPEPPAAE